MTKKAKRYYWLKLKEDFFDEDTIEWIEEQENGKEYCLFYLKMCLKSIKTEGLLIRKVGNILVPYDAKHLAKITNTDIDTVKIAMNLFQKIGLIQVLESGEIYIPGMEDMIGSETEKAKLMRNKRAKDKALLQEGNNVTTNSNLVTDNSNIVTNELLNCYTEKEKEKEKEIEIEIDKELDSKIEDNHTNEQTDNNLSDYSILYEKNIGLINQITAEWLMEISQTIDFPLFKRGVEICTERGKISLGYLKGVIKRWIDNNITTYEQLKAYELQKKANQKKKEFNLKIDSLGADDDNRPATQEELDELARLEEMLEGE